MKDQISRNVKEEEGEEEIKERKKGEINKKKICYFFLPFPINCKTKFPSFPNIAMFTINFCLFVCLFLK